MFAIYSHKLNSLVKEKIFIVNQAGGNQNQRRDLTPNHYAQMRPYDPSKPPPCIPNGHQHTSFHRPAFVHPLQQAEINWKNHVQMNQTVSRYLAYQFASDNYYMHFLSGQLRGNF